MNPAKITFIKKANKQMESVHELEDKKDHNKLSSDKISSDFCMHMYKRKTLSW